MIHNAAWPVGGSFLGTERGMPVQRNGRGFAARSHCEAIAWLCDAAENQSGDRTCYEKNLRLISAKADNKKTQVAQLTNEVVRIDDVRRGTGRRYGGVVHQHRR